MGREQRVQTHKQQLNIKHTKKRKEKALEKIIEDDRKLQSLHTKYSEELRNKGKFDYKKDISETQFLNMLVRQKKFDLFREWTQNYIQEQFAKDYLDHYGLPDNYTIADMPDFDPNKRNSQKFNFDFDDRLYNELISVKKVQLLPTMVKKVRKLDKDVEHFSTYYVSRINGQTVLFLKVESHSKNDIYLSDIDSSYKLFAFVQGKKEGCLCLMRYDHVCCGNHENLLNEKNEYKPEKQVVSDAHIHLPNLLFSVMFPAKVNSSDAVTLKEKFKTFNDAVDYFDKKIKLGEKALFVGSDDAEGISISTAYKKYHDGTLKDENVLPANLKPLKDYLTNNTHDVEDNMEGKENGHN